MNNHDKTSLVDFIFKRIAIYVFVPVCLLCLVIAYLIYHLTLDIIFTPIDQALYSMQQTSKQIEVTLEGISHQVDEIVATPSMLDNPRRLHGFFYNITLTLPYVFGTGYAFTPEYRHFGEYQHLTPNNKVATESMLKVYAKRHTDYSQRPWFKRAISSGKPVTIQTSRNIFGPPINLITYSFPIKKNGKALLVGTMDVPISAFGESLARLTDISKYSFSSVTIYYVSTPSDKPADTSFFNILNASHPLNDAHLVAGLKKIALQGKYNTWTLSGHYSYKKVSYLLGGATFIIQFDITGLVVLTALWLVMTLLTLYVITRRLKKSLVTRLASITNPIAQLSDNAQNLAQLHLEIPYEKQPKPAHIAEIDHLISSLEQMRHNLIILIDKEKQLEKTHGELALASRIQHKFISPYYSANSQHKNTRLAIEARLQTANLLSGDIYDCVTIKDSVYCLIGDATGKDITAAIFASFVLADFKTLCDQQNAPDRILNSLNDYLHSMDAEDMFISAICLKIDFINNTLEFAVAGHDFPIVHNQQNEFVTYSFAEPDPVLGILSNHPYHLYSMSLNQCKHILLFTDGVTEAMNLANQPFGLERLVQLIKQNLEDSCPENSLCQSILQTCHAFESGCNRDDKTIISIQLCR